MLENHVKSVLFAHQDRPQEAFQAQLEACKAFREIWQSASEQPWLMAPLETLTRDLRLLAVRSDDRSATTGDTMDALSVAVRLSLSHPCFQQKKTFLYFFF